MSLFILLVGVSSCFRPLLGPRNPFPSLSSSCCCILLCGQCIISDHITSTVSCFRNFFFFLNILGTERGAFTLSYKSTPFESLAKLPGLSSNLCSSCLSLPEYWHFRCAPLYLASVCVISDWSGPRPLWGEVKFPGAWV